MQIAHLFSGSFLDAHFFFLFFFSSKTPHRTNTLSKMHSLDFWKKVSVNTNKLCNLNICGLARPESEHANTLANTYTHTTLLTLWMISLPAGHCHNRHTLPRKMQTSHQRFVFHLLMNNKTHCQQQAFCVLTACTLLLMWWACSHPQKLHGLLGTMEEWDREWEPSPTSPFTELWALFGDLTKLISCKLFPLHQQGDAGCIWGMHCSSQQSRSL